VFLSVTRTCPKMPSFGGAWDTKPSRGLADRDAAGSIQTAGNRRQHRVTGTVSKTLTLLVPRFATKSLPPASSATLSPPAVPRCRAECRRRPRRPCLRGRPHNSRRRASVSTLKHPALITEPAATQAMTMGSVSFAIAFRPKPKVTAGRLAPQYVSASTQCSSSTRRTAHGDAVLPAITGDGLSQPWDVALEPANIAAQRANRSAALMRSWNSHAYVTSVVGAC